MGSTPPRPEGQVQPGPLLWVLTSEHSPASLSLSLVSPQWPHPQWQTLSQTHTRDHSGGPCLAQVCFGPLAPVGGAGVCGGPDTSHLGRLEFIFREDPGSVAEIRGLQDRLLPQEPGHSTFPDPRGLLHTHVLPARPSWQPQVLQQPGLCPLAQALFAQCPACFSQARLAAMETAQATCPDGSACATSPQTSWCAGPAPAGPRGA